MLHAFGGIGTGPPPNGGGGEMFGESGENRSGWAAAGRGSEDGGGTKPIWGELAGDSTGCGVVGPASLRA